MVDGTDVPSVARALTTLLLAPEHAGAMGEAGRRWVSEEWSWEASARRLTRLLTPENTPATP